MIPTASPARTVRPLDDEAQSLIDARLDTIERMLAGRTTRGDRLAIVREVEAQLHDLLAERNPDDTDRDAVVAALAHLDPPEAYIPDAATGAVPRPGGTTLPGHPGPPARRQAIRSTGGKVSAAFGLSGLLSFYWFFSGLTRSMRSIHPPTHDELIMTLGIFLGLIAAQNTAAIAFAAYGRFDDRWAIVGTGLGIFTAIVCTICPVLLVI